MSFSLFPLSHLETFLMEKHTHSHVDTDENAEHLHLLNQLNIPSMFLLMSPHKKQLRRHCLYLPPALAPVNEL